MAKLHLIRKLCQEREITIRELAQKVGRDESSIQSAIRRGSTNTNTVEKIAQILKVPPAIFFDGFAPDSSVAHRREIAYLKELLKEKERTIEILMSNRANK